MIQLLSRRTAFTSSLHQYGDVVEIYFGSLPGYVVTDKDIAHQILVDDAANYERGRIYEKIRPVLGDGIATASGRRYQRHRRLIQPAFHHEQIAGYVAMMAAQTAQMVDSWRPGKTCLLHDDMQVLASTIVGKALFSTSLEDAALGELLRSFMIIADQVAIRSVSPAVVNSIPTPAKRHFDQANTHARLVVRQVVADRHARAEEDHHDLLSMLLSAHDHGTGDGLTDEEVHDEIASLFFAGSEAPSRMLSWFFYELGRHSDIEARVLAEIDAVIGAAPVTAHNIARLAYTRQVINEILRHYSAWLMMRRPIVDVELGGVRIAAGTEIVVSPHALHHDPRYFPDPYRFDPDRWSPERAPSVPRGAFIPFSTGVHQCIGDGFALAEIATVIATALSRVRLRPAPGREVRPKATILPKPDRPMRMTVHHR